MLQGIRKAISRNLVNMQGWRTDRKFIVIESDDWGSIRMPSEYVYYKLLKSGVRVDKCPYNKFDSLASEDDLDALFNVLKGYQDKNGHNPVLTANTVVANPDFEKIRFSGYNEYHYEPFIETFHKYAHHDNVFELWRQGINESIFCPQFHGREHLNITLWLSLLQRNEKTFRLAFDNGLWGLGPTIINTGRINIQAAFDATEKNEIIAQKEIIKDGLFLFEKLLGYKSKSFIANNYIWDSNLNDTLATNEVTIFQGMKYQLLPLIDSQRRSKIRHFMGERNQFDQVYLIRNCVFEPTLYPGIDSVSSCLKDIESAFLWKKPAIITSHRLNFIGFINQKNRDNNLISFKKLLRAIINKWPDVEFMTSCQLGSTILSS